MKQLTQIMIHILILYGLYCFGVWIQTTFHLFVPGSIIGMILLFTLLATGVVKDAWIERGTTFLLNYMPLLFVPVTVGIINYLDLFSGKGFILVLIVLLSTVIVMVGGGILSEWVLKKEIGNDD